MWPFDQNNQPMYQQYAQAYNTNNYSGMDPNQAWGNVHQFMQNAPWETQQNLFQQHFGQMPYEQRMAFAQQMPPQYGVNPNDPQSMAMGFLRLHQERPDLLQRIFSHPVLLGGGVALAGLIAAHMIKHHEREQFVRMEEQQAPFGYAPQPQFGGYDPMLDQERREERKINRELREERELNREIRREERELDQREWRERERGW